MRNVKTGGTKKKFHSNAVRVAATQGWAASDKHRHYDNAEQVDYCQRLVAQPALEQCIEGGRAGDKAHSATP